MVDVQKFISDLLPEAESEAAESRRLAMNSYGAGYDRGYVDALKEVLGFINDNRLTPLDAG